ncbi:MAG: TonB C-terminal domain-containing protein, partial [Rhodocyclaceae bacterium]|nr:TonB C-terminal domain-containing protein [Rhodocyclaceae bacterium]
MNAALFEDREDPGRKASAALAVAVHVALAVLLVYGIRWQTRSPEAVEVELVRALPAPAPA